MESLDTNLETLKSKDKKIAASTNSLCIELGKSGCKLIKNACNGSLLPNFCFNRSFLFSIMDVATCESNDFEACSRERENYENKFIEFSESYANEPGIARAAVNICAPFHKESISHPTAKIAKQNLDKVIEGAGVYYNFKELYSCIEESYQEMAKGALSPKK
ncbi:hypothetical protein LG290_06740 [Halomonas sediminis]